MVAALVGVFHVRYRHRVSPGGPDSLQSGGDANAMLRSRLLSLSNSGYPVPMRKRVLVAVAVVAVLLVGGYVRRKGLKTDVKAHYTLRAKMDTARANEKTPPQS